MQRDEVAHLPSHRRDANLEPALGAAVTVPHPDHDRAAAAGNPPDPVAGAQVVDVQVEGPRLHRAIERSQHIGPSHPLRVAAVIALTAGIALIIGWYRGFNLRALELAAAVFAVVLATQTMVLIVTGGEIGSRYWPIVGLVAAGWLVCVWVGSFARSALQR